MSVHFSSQCLNWQTPDAVYQALHTEFDFNWDPCPHKPRFGEHGLKIVWGTRAFCNPPYGREIGKWMAKAYQESLKGKLVVLLVPSRTDTGWWHDYVMRADEIRFIRGRLRFKGAKYNAPFPSAVVIFRGGNHDL